MKLPENSKGILGNTAYTIGGALLMNGVLQAVVYPRLNHVMGAEALGNLLYIMGLVAILCPSIGQSLNTGRLVIRREADVSNGDFDTLLLLFGGAGTAVCLVMARGRIGGPGEMVFAALLLMATIFRYYGDVEYRLSLHYRRYFIYYTVLTAGYLAGFILYHFTGIWYLIFICGEVLALLYLTLTGSVFDSFLERSRYFRRVVRRESYLVVSYLLTNLTLNVDRLLLAALIGNLAVTQYYVTSLIGKTLVLLVAPVNTIIISYLTKRNVRLDRKQFLKYAGIGFLVALFFFAAAQVGTPLFIWLFYRNLFDSVRSIVTVVNLSQILGLLSTYLFMIVLTFSDERWQFGLQLIHLGVLLVLIFSIGRGSLMGFSTAVLIANALRIGAVMLLGFIKSDQLMPPPEKMKT